MAFIETVASGGGGETGTLLWENDPTLPAITTNIQLSDSVDNYSKIRIEYYPFGTRSPHTISDAEKCELIIPTGLISNISYNATGAYCVFASGYGTNFSVYCPVANDRTILAPMGGASTATYGVMKIKAIYGIS